MTFEDFDFDFKRPKRAVLRAIRSGTYCESNLIYIILGKVFRSFWNVAKFYSYSRHGNQCQRSRQASPLKSVGRDLKTENPPPFFSAGWLQRGNF